MFPSLSELQNFTEVAVTLNISRAAERLGISQPSLTLSIQRLEASIGTKLFIRSKRGVTLTQGGKQLFLSARDLLQRWEAVRAQAIASTVEIQGHYTLGCHVSVALYTFPGFMATILETYPRLEIKLVHELSRKIFEQIIQMEVDLGIVVNPICHPDVIIKKLCQDEVTFWRGKGNRKIQNSSSNEAVLILDPELLQTQELLKKLQHTDIKYGRILTSSSLEVITKLTESGAGIGILPSRVAQSAGLIRVADAPSFIDNICLLYRVENRNVKSLQIITSHIVDLFAKTRA